MPWIVGVAHASPLRVGEGPGFASVEDKRIGMDPRRLHLYGARYDVVEQKMLAVMTSHLLGNGRWDGIRVARGALLEDLCGHAYMPATLDSFTRELQYLGVSSTLCGSPASGHH